MVDSKDRAAYEQGVRDSQKGIFEELVTDSVEAALPNTRTSEEDAAYYKGRRGEQFDEDKEDE
jgi:hypothetical protein